ncbi:hypothetical protein [Streptomyces sp. ME19-01-6]|uniref:hypothetical protein n=1 Tax=Streptomyces sp. ME19-01-6 TaxID=3028686 RepID=UPI00299FD14D|nr:hypothetical protein [Streptomyces sp. ME19-01-6]MDX3225092.1 hypothetical protein [Streptomyces sp. ME19-01-6]
MERHGRAPGLLEHVVGRHQRQGGVPGPDPEDDAVSTSAGSGETSSRRSASVLDEATGVIGTTSPVVGRVEAMKLWWVSSSSSIRMPVCRSTFTVAQDQKAASSSWVRFHRLPVTTSVA